MKRIILLSIFLIISAGIYSVENNVFRHINADIIVTDKKAAADHFVNWAEKQGRLLCQIFRFRGCYPDTRFQ